MAAVSYYTFTNLKRILWVSYDLRRKTVLGYRRRSVEDPGAATRLQEIQAEVRKCGGPEALAIPCDCSKPEEVEKLKATLLDVIGVGEWRPMEARHERGRYDVVPGTCEWLTKCSQCTFIISCKLWKYLDFGFLFSSLLSLLFSKTFFSCIHSKANITFSALMTIISSAKKKMQRTS